MRISYIPVQIEVINDGTCCFLELQREGFKEGQIVNAQRQIINGKESKWFYVDQAAFYLGETCRLIQVLEVSAECENEAESYLSKPFSCSKANQINSWFVRARYGKSYSLSSWLLPLQEGNLITRKMHH